MNIPLTTRDLDRHEAERIPLDRMPRIERHYSLEPRLPVSPSFRPHWHQRGHTPVRLRFGSVRARFVVALVVVAVWAVL